MIRREVSQSTEFTYHLETDGDNGIGWSDGKYLNIIKLTYELEKDEEDAMERSDDRYSNN